MEVMVVMAILVCRLSLPSEPYFQGITVLLIGNWTLGHLLVEIKTVYPCIPTEVFKNYALLSCYDTSPIFDQSDPVSAVPGQPSLAGPLRKVEPLPGLI